MNSIHTINGNPNNLLLVNENNYVINGAYQLTEKNGKFTNPNYPKGSYSEYLMPAPPAEDDDDYNDILLKAEQIIKEGGWDKWAGRWIEEDEILHVMKIGKEYSYIEVVIAVVCWRLGSNKLTEKSYELVKILQDQRVPNNVGRILIFDLKDRIDSVITKTGEIYIRKI